jgi:RNA-binding protein
MSMASISAAERKALKARAHSLHPILQLGEKGLTDSVVAEIDRALGAHELIKIRAASLNRDEREVALASICERTQCHPVQHIGKMLVLYRQKPLQESEPGPRPRLRKRGKPSSGWDERKDARKKPARRRKSAGPQRPQRRRPRA